MPLHFVKVNLSGRFRHLKRENGRAATWLQLLRRHKVGNSTKYAKRLFDNRYVKKMVRTQMGLHGLLTLSCGQRIPILRRFRGCEENAASIQPLDGVTR